MDADIPEHAVTLRFVHSSGPGGQHVNKVSTAVQLRLRLGHTSLPESVKARLRALAGHKLTKQDELIINAERYRSQLRNKEDAYARLDELVAAARTRRKSRVPTRPSAGSVRARLNTKKQKGKHKPNRRKPALD